MTTTMPFDHEEEMEDEVEMEVDLNSLVEAGNDTGMNLDQDPLDLGDEAITSEEVIDLEDPSEFIQHLINVRDIETGATTPATERTVLILPPVSLIVSQKEKAVTSEGTRNSFNVVEEFRREMEQNLTDIVKECITILKKDPREYHPFYLRVYKYITLGQRRGFFDPSEQTAKAIWTRYDKYARELFERSKTEKIPFSSEKSPYLTYILFGKVIRNGIKVPKPTRFKGAIQKLFVEIEAKGKEIVLKRTETGKLGDIRNDISARLEFFNFAKTVTLPWDCITMNNIWNKFVNEFVVTVPIRRKRSIASSCEGVSSASATRKNTKTIPVKTIDLDLDLSTPPPPSQDNNTSSSNSSFSSLSQKFSMYKHKAELIKEKRLVSSVQPSLSSTQVEEDENVQTEADKPQAIPSEPSMDSRTDKGNVKSLSHEDLKEYQLKWVGKDAQLQRKKAELAKRKAACIKKRLIPKQKASTDLSLSPQGAMGQARKTSKLNTDTSNTKNVIRQTTERGKSMKALASESIPEKTTSKASHTVKRPSSVRKLLRPKALKEDLMEYQAKWVSKGIKQTKAQLVKRKAALVKKRLLLKGKGGPGLSLIAKATVAKIQATSRRPQSPQTTKGKKSAGERLQAPSLPQPLKVEVEDEESHNISETSQAETSPALLGLRRSSRRRKATFNLSELYVSGDYSDDDNDPPFEAPGKSSTLYQSEGSSSKTRKISHPLKKTPSKKSERKTSRSTPSKADPSRKREACDICGESFYSNAKLLQHRKQSHPYNIYSCSWCTKTFKSLGNLQSHCNFMHTDKQLDKANQTPEPQRNSEVNDEDPDPDDPDFEPAIDNQNSSTSSPSDDSDNDEEISRRKIVEPDAAQQAQTDTVTVTKSKRKSSVRPESSTIKSSEEKTQAAGTELKFSIRPKPNWKNEPRVCEECGKTFTRKVDYENHLKRVHGSEGFQCPSCPKTFRTEHQLCVHYEYRHIGIPSNKGITTTTNPKRRRVCNPNPNPKPPAKAGKTYEDVATPGSTSCDICDKQFQDPMGARRHMYEIHGDGALAQNFPICPECGKSYKNKDSLGQHIRQVHEGIDFRCDVCNRMCQTAGKLYRHQTEVHGMDLPPPPNVIVYQCEYCGEKLLRGLEVHVRKSHPERLEEFRENVRGKQETRPKGKKWEPDTDNPITYSAFKKREQRALLREKGADAVEGLVPKWLLPKQCPICGDMISGHGFRLHVRKHETGVWVRREVRNKHGELAVQTGMFVDILKAYLQKAKLVKRVSLGKGKSVFNCNLCKFDTKGFLEMKVHFLATHPDSCSQAHSSSNASQFLPKVGLRPVKLPPTPTVSEKRMDCKHCKENFSEGELRSHLESVHPEKCWKCSDCSKVFLTPMEMSRHSEVGCEKDNEQEDPSPPDEEIPDETFPLPDLPVAVMVANPLILDTSCKRCSTVPASLGELRSHVEKSHPNEYFPCNFCQRVCHTGRGLLEHFHNSHKASNHMQPDVARAREELRKSFPPYEHLQVTCPLCQKTISLAHYSRGHLKNYHDVVVDSSLECRFCHSVHKDNSRFLTHIEEHHGHQADMEEFVKIVTTAHADLGSKEIKNLAPQQPPHTKSGKGRLKKKAVNRGKAKSKPKSRPGRKTKRRMK